MRASDAHIARARPTAKDVADAVGVSRSAVSFAFNDPTRVSTATRERILAVARELGYTPHPVGRMLQKGSTRCLGVLLPHDIPKVMENPYYARFLMGLGQVCSREGLSLLLTPPEGGSTVKAIQHAAVDGFVVCGLDADRGEVDELARRAIPFVLVDSDAPAGIASVDIDDRKGAHDVTQHLLELGHRRIAVLGVEQRSDRPARTYRDPLVRRMAGIEDVLAGAGMSMRDVTVVEASSCTRMEGYRAAKTIMSVRPRPTAIIVLADLMAFGAVDALRDLGLDIPGDVSVTGFDDLPESQWMRPRLTTVRQPITAKGRIAGDFLISAIRGEDQHPHQVLHTVLVTRESSGPPAPSAD